MPEHPDSFFVEINPFDKIDEIITKFSAYNPTVFSKQDKGYDWLEEEYAKCIVFVNPHYNRNIEIDIGDRDEFTLYFADNHNHYANYQYDYELMIDSLAKLLTNVTCAGTITDSNGKWYGSQWVEKEEITMDPEQVFDYVFKYPEFSKKLHKNGYTITYDFWDPQNNKVLTFDKKHGI